MSFGLIAGHVFEYDIRSRRVCKSCGSLWVHVASATRDDIGKTGIAHVGTLIESEYDQISQERDRIYEQVTYVASSPGYTPPGDKTPLAETDVYS